MSGFGCSSTGGIWFLGTLTILFVALKLCDVIAWSWWWVLIAVWLPITLLVTHFLASAIVELCILVCTAIFGK